MYYILLQNVTTLLWQLHFVKFCQTMYYILLQNVNVRKTKRDLMVGFEPRTSSLGAGVAYQLR